MKAAARRKKTGLVVRRVGPADIPEEAESRSRREVARRSSEAVLRLEEGRHLEDAREADRLEAGRSAAARSPPAARRGGTGEGCGPWAGSRARPGGLEGVPRAAADPGVVAATCRRVAETCSG